MIKGKPDRGTLEIVDTESLIPRMHILRRIDASIDFNQLYDYVAPLYEKDDIKTGVDPVVLFKMLLIQHIYGLPSMQRTAEDVSLNIAYRWFLGYQLQQETPGFLTVRFNLLCHYTEEVVCRVLTWLFEKIVTSGCADFPSGKSPEQLLADIPNFVQCLMRELRD